jgi:hypothetical protein
VDTHNVLRLWQQPTFLCRLGLFHSAYSNSYVNLAIFDQACDRPLVRDAIGAEAEALTHKLCIVPRHDIVWDHLAEDGRVPAEGMTTKHIRTGEAVQLSASELRHLLVFTMADIAEQYAGWQALHPPPYTHRPPHTHLPAQTHRPPNPAHSPHHLRARTARAVQGEV